MVVSIPRTCSLAHYTIFVNCVEKLAIWSEMPDVTQYNNLLNSHSRLLELILTDLNIIVARSFNENCRHSSLLIRWSDPSAVLTFNKAERQYQSFNFRKHNLNLLTSRMLFPWKLTAITFIGHNMLRELAIYYTLFEKCFRRLWLKISRTSAPVHMLVYSCFFYFLYSSGNI